MTICGTEGLGHSLRRRKAQDAIAGSESSGPALARVLGAVDLTALGVGSTLGLGVYVLAGSVAKTVAGPAVCLSFLVAAVASAFAGLCYAEFAARVPRAGSAYVYSYVSVGEGVAFTIGWNLVLEYVIGTASVAKGMANYVDALAGSSIRAALQRLAPMSVSFLADYPDFFAFGLVAVITVLLSVGVKESTRLNNAFTALNLATVVVVIIAGAVKSDVKNWQLSVEDIPTQYRAAAGAGGFAPWGAAGVMAGAAKCFFGFVGFDCVATTGEEAKNPKKNIPIAIVMSLVIIFLAYFSISTVLTMMWPYYLQDADAPFPYAFEQSGLPAVKWLVTVGAIFALCTSLLGAMFPLPRVLYAMAADGVLFRPLAKVHERTRTPLLATVVSGLLAGIMAMLFNLNQLIDMMSIGTLLAYTIVAISVLILRYDEEETVEFGKKNPLPVVESGSEMLSMIKRTFNLNGIKHPDNFSASLSKLVVTAFFIAAAVTSALVSWAGPDYYSLVAVFGAFLLLLLFVLYRQPTQNASHLTFKVPLVPLLPGLSVLMNLYLMAQLDAGTWIRFAVWLAVGYAIYFGYGIRHSVENNSVENQVTSSQASTVTVTADKPEECDKEKIREITKC